MKRFYCDNVHGHFEANTLQEIKTILKPFAYKARDGFGNGRFLIYDNTLPITNKGIIYRPAPKKQLNPPI